MKLLALEKDEPGVADNAFTEEILKREAARVWELQQKTVSILSICFLMVY
ncbi:MAG TPA: hypothetical protein VMU30_00945 [Bacteroidota bacterium]|nr:hypothetical protein [Bacteroidota bacterium]